METKQSWYIYAMEYYLTIKRNAFEPLPVRWKNLEPVIQSAVSQKEEKKYCILMYTERENLEKWY